jgi:hypothetical protein
MDLSFRQREVLYQSILPGKIRRLVTPGGSPWIERVAFLTRQAHLFTWLDAAWVGHTTSILRFDCRPGQLDRPAGQSGVFGTLARSILFSLGASASLSVVVAGPLVLLLNRHIDDRLRLTLE